MIAVICILFVCITALLAQYCAYQHELKMVVGMKELKGVQARLQELETSRATQYNHAVFEDLKSKVEALRIAQGMKGSR